MRSLLLACSLGLSAVCCNLPAQVAPKAPADAPLTPDEAKKLQAVMAKATASPEAKTAEENLRKAREELAKATQAYQTSVEKAAIDADPAAAPVIEKTRRLQQESLARRNATQSRRQHSSWIYAPSGASRRRTGPGRPADRHRPSHDWLTSAFGSCSTTGPPSACSSRWASSPCCSCASAAELTKRPAARSALFPFRPEAPILPLCASPRSPSRP
jgi:hypothetical protein